MGKAAILYHSRTGTTRDYARAISEHVQKKGMEVQLASIQDYQARKDILNDVDTIFLGCWTKGLMVIFQHPDKDWKEFAAGLSPALEARLALFTTYKIATGSMFRNMYRHLQGKYSSPALELQSRKGSLSEDDASALDQFLAGAD
jgi:flavodoxin